ncbi:MAG: TolC family protein [Desulfobacterales bacterium]|nr:TolC family protein [Desulfobacterales bacterium]
MKTEFLKTIVVIGLCLGVFNSFAVCALASETGDFNSIPVTLSLDEAVRIALLNRFEISVADKHIQQLKAELTAAESNLYPRIDLTGDTQYTKLFNKDEPYDISFDYEDIQYKITPTRDSDKYLSGITLSLTQNLYTGGQTENDIKGAQKRVQVGEFAKQVEKRNIAHSVIQAYWELKKTEYLSEVEKQAMDQSEKILKTSQARHQSGAISKLEKDRAEAEYLKIRIGQIQTEVLKNNSADSLLQQMGINNPRTNMIQLSDGPENEIPLENEDNDNLIEPVLSKRPEILKIRQEIGAKENNVKIAQSGYYPRIYLKSEYYLTGNKDDLYKSWSGLSRDNWSVNLNFQFNIFEGFLTKSKIRQAVADKASSQKELAGTKQNIKHEIRQAANLVYGKKKELKTAAKVVHIEQQNLTAVEKEFELGVSSVDRVADYHIRLIEARKTYFTTLVDLEIAKSDLKWAKGEELP